MDRQSILARLLSGQPQGSALAYDPSDWRSLPERGGGNSVGAPALTNPSPNFVEGVRGPFMLPQEGMQTPAEADRRMQFANAMTGFVGNTDPFRGIRAYHGSPHQFDRFSMERIGTGEGAQVYGHGLYFAQHEDVARAYRDALSNGRRGHMYEVSLNTSPSRLLDWDAPLAAQPDTLRALGVQPMTRGVDPQEVVAAMRAAREAGVPPSQHPAYIALQERQAQAGRARWDGLGIRPEPGVNPGDLRGSEYYGALAQTLGDQRLATERLRDAGLDGIQYLDSGSRFGTGAGTRNYVMFDDNTVEILRRYGLLPLTVGGAAAGANRDALAQALLGQPNQQQ